MCEFLLNCGELLKSWAEECWDAFLMVKVWEGLLLTPHQPCVPVAVGEGTGCFWEGALVAMGLLPFHSLYLFLNVEVVSNDCVSLAQRCLYGLWEIENKYICEKTVAHWGLRKWNDLQIAIAFHSRCAENWKEDRDETQWALDLLCKTKGNLCSYLSSFTIHTFIMIPKACHTWIKKINIK